MNPQLDCEELDRCSYYWSPRDGRPPTDETLRAILYDCELHMLRPADGPYPASKETHLTLHIGPADWSSLKRNLSEEVLYGMQAFDSDLPVLYGIRCVVRRDVEIGCWWVEVTTIRQAKPPYWADDD